MSVDGVKQARIEWQSGRAWARYDPAKTNPEALVDAINKKTIFKATLPPGSGLES